MNSKYSNILTIVLIVVIVIIIGIIAFLGYNYYKNVISKSNAEDFVDSFIGDSETNVDQDSTDNDDDENQEEENTDDDDWTSGIQQGENNGENSSSGQQYKGFDIAGTMEIPAINLKYPVIAESDYSKSALETSLVELHGVGLNKVGNTTVVGHNYRDGTFFSNNKKLNIGDKIYVTDLTGKRLSYTIYDKYETTDTDATYMTRDTQGKIEISLSTCTDDTKNRLIILAKADS